MTGLRTSLVSIGLRGAAVTSKFLLLFFMARFMAPADVGVYGLVVATISYAILLLGLEFYTYCTREILSQGTLAVPHLFRDQLVLQGMVYLAALPLLSLLFWLGILPWRYAGWFYGLLVLEHMSRESYRLLVALMRPLKANVVAFIDAGAWPVMVLLLMAVRPDLRSLPTLWMAWSGSITLSLVLAGWWLRDLDWQRGFREPVNWRWIRKGVLTSLVMLSAALCFNGIITVDRYFIKHFLGSDMVGVYVFFAGIASIIMAFMDSGVISVRVPKLVQAYQRQDGEAYSHHLRSLAVSLVGGAALLIACCVIGIHPVVRILGKDLYAAHLSVYWLLMGMFFFWVVSLIPHYVLYARKMDLAIALSNLVGFLLAVAGYYFLIPLWGIQGAALGGGIAVLGVGITKALFLWISGVSRGKGRAEVRQYESMA